MLERLQLVLRESWEAAAIEVTRFLPHLLGAIVLVLVGAAFGWAAGRLTRWLLWRAKADLGAERLGAMGPLRRLGIDSPSAFLGRAVRWGITLASFVPALYSLDAPLAADLVRRVLLYLPHLVVAVALLWAGVLVGRFLGRSVLIAAVNAGIESARLLAALTRWGVLLLVSAVALEHLGIGRATVLTAFAILFGGITLALAIAAGLGSQDVVRQWWAGRLHMPERTEQEPFRHW
ncbi:MAG: conserved rane protein of unknown function [Acidobacteria bacterium]|nr:conserved rane protein of unknown function [Acidobacteriota bacterium]